VHSRPYNWNFWKHFGCKHMNTSWTHGRDEEAQLSLGWIPIGSKLSSLNFNSSVRAEQSFAIRYPKVVIKSLCGNLDISLNYYANAYFRSRNSVHVLSVADRNRKWKISFWNRAVRSCSWTFFRNPFRSRKTQHTNASTVRAFHYTYILFCLGIARRFDRSKDHND